MYSALWDITTVGNNVSIQVNEVADLADGEV